MLVDDWSRRRRVRAKAASSSPLYRKIYNSGLGRIRILSDNIANKIAAGEVVERPASVVKELLENSLNAGSKEFLIQVEAGGRRLIRIADDGCGMLRDD